MAQELGKVRVWIEKSTGPGGPWEEVDLSTVEKDPAGNPVMAADGQQFFRTRIERFDGTQTGPVVLPLTEVPKFHLDLVQSFLKGALDAEGADDGGEWPEDAELASFVRQLDAVSGDGSFHVIARTPLGPTLPERAGAPTHQTHTKRGESGTVHRATRGRRRRIPRGRRPLHAGTRPALRRTP